MHTPLFQLAQRAATDAGFERIGVAPASHPEMRELEYFSEWIDAGYAGEMGYLKRRSDSGEYKRTSLEQALPWAKSVVVVAINYNPPAPKSTEPAAATQGWISRYALSPGDYHNTVLHKLRRIESALLEDLRTAGVEVMTRSYVDTGPVLERVYAKYAGIGWVGKNTCIINQQLGSWVFLGVIVTSLEHSAFVAEEKLAIAADRCGSCTRCIDACPTEAIVAPRQLDASRCIAYFTIEKRGAIPTEMREKVGRHVFGCDICQDVCPWNRKSPITTNPDFLPDSSLVNPDLAQLARISEQEFRHRFRGSPMSRAKYAGFLRNVAIAMANSNRSEYVADLEELAASEDPVVSDHAKWAINHLNAKKNQAQLSLLAEIAPSVARSE
ncbi:MAG: tRNA epoxyqueuosine(34) reductase QueG [Acidobacteria bacterium]|nr:MAG: tRNA epoxyqueuosine(34) reductase QueG [Acidobacteriota bacterium]